MTFFSKATRRITSLTAIIAAAAMISCTAFPMVSSAAEQQTGLVVADALNVRSGPGLNHYIRYIIPQGKKVEVIETNKNGWYKIRFGNKKTGWVSGDFISIGGKVGTTIGSSQATTAKKTTATKKTTTTTKKATTTTKKTTTTTKKTTTTTKAPKKSSVDLGKGIIKVTGSYTNLRKGNGTQYAIIRKLYQNTEGGIIEKNGSWYKIKLADSTVGWVSVLYVQTIGYKASSSPVNTPSGTGKIIINVSSLNVRSNASTKSKLIATVRKNEVYKYSEIKNGWYKIVTPSGSSGYVSGDYVSKFKNYAINGGGKYIWPTQTAKRISCRFNPTVGRGHKGMDIAAPGGAQILAVASGKVVQKVYSPNGYGHLVVIEQNDGIRAYYAHMKKASFLEIGDKVSAGDTIGIVGTTGRSTGNHLHLEFRRGTDRINPLDFYPAFN